ncbi:hypothetical protein [Muriicola marianensis]|uniref:PH domain-containing protein n=1 Tax=Muriicola marianensis TaxID=1324801 RepID=A0ABQ1R1W5_9FLAO|nr:hypothetical protein [Muriicola marianensis]GGD53436.1 hypothetical protein GCM10011361_20160 [Muriicola marianensis]
MHYARTQYSYLTLLLTLAAGTFFTRVYLSALAEPPSYDSGPNFLMTSIMVLIVGFLFTIASLRITIDEHHLRIRMGLGLFRKKFVLRDITSVQAVRNPWYYGQGIRKWFWPGMWIYSVSGLDAVEIELKNGKKYRIGTDEPDVVRHCILRSSPSDPS